MSNFPLRPSQLPVWGNNFSQKMCKALFLAQGWSIEGSIPNVPKAVAIIAPHTSNIDGWFGFLALGGIGIKMTVLAKDRLFVPPFHHLLKWVGMLPVTREHANGLTQQVAAIFKQHDQLWIGMAPEGTRKNASGFKSGFYHIALHAQVPIVMFSFDYEKKIIHCLGSFEPTGNYQQDLDVILKYYQGHFSARNDSRLSKALQNLEKNL